VELGLRRKEIRASLEAGKTLAFNQFKIAAKELAQLPSIGFKPVGPGLPLTVQVRQLYTGKYPDNWLHKADMLLTSSVKNLDQFDASARAVNFLVPKQEPKAGFTSPPADQNGTPIVCYVPAVTAVKTTLTFNLIFQNFDDEVLKLISGVFQNAAQIPLFMAASPYLIGAGSVLKLAGDVGDALFNGDPDYSPTVTLNFSDVGEAVQPSGFFVLFKNKVDPNANPDSMTFDVSKGLVDPATKKPYGGPAPYIVISVDGTQQDSLRSFLPSAASAATLAKFFNVKEGGLVPLGDITDAMKALNDVKFHNTAKTLQDQINAAQTTEEKAALQKQREAAIANIQNLDLRPKEIGPGPSSVRAA